MTPTIWKKCPICGADWFETYLAVRMHKIRMHSSKKCGHKHACICDIVEILDGMKD